MRWGLALCALFFAVYNLNFRHGSTVDTIPTTVLPVSLLREGDFDLDEFRALLATDTRALEVGLVFGALQERDGRLLSSYPVGSALLAAPLYAVALPLGLLDTWHDYRVMGKLAASLLTALSALFLFLTLRAWTAPGTARVLTLLYGLGTAAWPIVSQELWQHGSGMLCLAVALYACVLLERSSARAPAFLLGGALALAVACRLLNVIPALALSAFVLVHHRGRAVDFAVLPVLGAALLGSYNWTVYGDLSGGYDALYQSQWHAWRGLTTTTVYTHPLAHGLASVLLSPSKGLFAYSPHFVVALASLPLLWTGKPPVARYLALWVVLHSVVLAKNVLWWGGTSFGPRYFAEASLPLTLLIGLAMPAGAEQRSLRLGLLITGCLSVAVQSVGAFFAPCGWAEHPVFADSQPERHWDWRDTELERCVRRGWDQGPLAPEILHGGSSPEDLT